MNNKLIMNYKAISRSDKVGPASEMQENNTIASFETNVPEECSIDKQTVCGQLSDLIKNPHTNKAAIELVEALLLFKQERHSSKSTENTQEDQLKNINEARSALCNRAFHNRELVPSFFQLCILIKNSSYFIQRNLPTTFKYFIQKLINDHTLIIDKNDKLYTFLIDSGVEFVTPLLKDYNDFSRAVVGLQSDEGYKQTVCGQLSDLITNSKSKEATLKLVKALLLFKQERHSSKSTKEKQEEQLNNINEARNDLVKTVDGNHQVPLFLALCILIKNNNYFIQRNLPTTFKNFIQKLINDGNLPSITYNSELKQFLIDSGVKFND